MVEVKPCFYYWLQSKFQTLKESDGLIDKKKARTFLRVYRIPKIMWNQVLKDMSDYELIECVNRFKMKLINIDDNPFKIDGIEYVNFNKWEVKNKD